MELEITSDITNFIELKPNISLVKNLLSTSIILIADHQKNSYKIYSDLNVKDLVHKEINYTFGEHLHLYHHGIVPHEHTGFANIIRIAPSLSYDLDSKTFQYLENHRREVFWTSEDVGAVEDFKNKLSNSVSDSDADGILFSGGIDSLLLAMLDKSKRPLLHINNDPIQKMIAEALAKELNRPLEIVEPELFESSDLQLARTLRKKGLGHYLPWNSGATYSKKTYDKKLISGQHADTLLMVDTFAPGINSHGAIWYARMLSSINKRAPYTLSFLGNSNDKALLLNKTVDSYDEHVELSNSQVRKLSPIKNKTVQALVSDQIFNHSEFVKYAKLIKIYRFCINANRIYREVEEVTGYNRDLIYYKPDIRTDLMNYLPGMRDCVNPKHLFYRIVNEHGLDYYHFKRRLLKNIINSRYFISRIIKQKSHHQSQLALRHIKWNASDLGLNFDDLLVDLNIKKSDTYRKSQLMIMDRRLNYLQYVS